MATFRGPSCWMAVSSCKTVSKERSVSLERVATDRDAGALRSSPFASSNSSSLPGGGGSEADRMGGGCAHARKGVGRDGGLYKCDR